MVTVKTVGISSCKKKISKIKGALFLKSDINVVFNALSSTNKIPFTSTVLVLWKKSQRWISQTPGK